MPEKTLKILIVEDDMLDRKKFVKELKGSGIPHELFVAEDYESGKEATNGKEYDCIFLDYSLPGGTGLELLKAIRESENLSPIIIVTGQGDEKLVVESMKLGADNYFPKTSIAADTIAQNIRQVIKGKEIEKRQRELERELSEAQKQLSIVVANAPIILFSLDKYAFFTLFEGKGLESIGIEKEKIVNSPFISENDHPIRFTDYERSMNGETHTEIIEWKDKYFEIFYSPIIEESKNITGVLGIASDITIRKHAEDELIKAKSLAEETAKIKEQFLANISHEIRTPMNGIIGLTGILINTDVSEEQMKYLQAIKTSSDDLLIIINDVLDFSKIEAGKMTIESVPFRVEDLVNHSIELFQSKADEKSLNLILEKDSNIPEFVIGDPTRLAQVLNNLVSNAIKFTENGEVRVSMRLISSEPKNITVCFEVKDTGIGISDKIIPTIFDSFTQASSDTTRKFGGTGLGLTIVKRLIELFNGEIMVKSKPGNGTTFSFTIPFAISKIHGSRQTGESTEVLNNHKIKILVAEDNKVNQMVVKKVLEDWNAETFFADNGLIAVQMLEKSDFDLILMDIQMPEMDGYTAVKKIRKEFGEPKKNIPIIAMTAHAINTERQKCIDAGMDDYISKPFDPAELKRKILAIIKLEIKTEKNSKIEKAIVNNSISKSQNNFKSSDINTPGTDGLVYNSIDKNFSSSVPKINLTYLKRIAEGNDAFVIEMIEMFLNKTPVALEQMNECFQKQNWEELKKIIHRIKPSFAYVGMQDIQNSLGKIESWNDENGDKKIVSELLNEIQSGSRSAFDLLRKELISLK